MIGNKGFHQKTSYEPKCRWSSYDNYKLIIWVWMVNETTVMFSPAEISHNGYYWHAGLQSTAVVFIGLPLVYSEICLAQYTNCNIITMWNFFPLFRNVGYATIYLIILKTIYLSVLTCWNFIYTFYATMDPPPWFNCDSFPDQKCMAKGVNVSIFQNCLEAQILFNDDCGMKTSSNCFYEREIGLNSTQQSMHCLFQWKPVIASTTLSLSLFMIMLRKEKCIQLLVKVLIFYISIMLLMLFCVALSTSGTWYATTISMRWDSLTSDICFESIGRALLSVGSGTGILVFLSRDVPFRSPGNMAAVSTPLFSVFVGAMLSLIAFSGVKTMSYFHGEEENVIELGFSAYFAPFASIAEILSYFDRMPVWAFCWFSGISFCLFGNLWILHLYLGDLLLEMKFARKYNKLTGGLFILFLNTMTWPFFCVDLTGVLTDATEIIQIANCFLFSLSFYWFYGYNQHNIDMLFMLGINASYFWKVAWLLNPPMVLAILYFKCNSLTVIKYSGDSRLINKLSINLNLLLLSIFLGIYISIILIGIFTQLLSYYRRGEIREVFYPKEDWGPRDRILFKSRKMFVPEIMTTEFLYRQVRIRGYYSGKKVNKPTVNRDMSESLTQETEWSAFTSN